ncbi:hypothetical protein [Streptomyces griseoluteus]|uniref:hypothetical protein n=1 Tax=Streptomyces griseoluteus TaxID=29306 RepID=UPI00370122FD
MTNGIAQSPPGTPRPKTTITIYTVTREGIVTVPRTTVAVSHDYAQRTTRRLQLLRHHETNRHRASCRSSP